MRLIQTTSSATAQSEATSAAKSKSKAISVAKTTPTAAKTTPAEKTKPAAAKATSVAKTNAAPPHPPQTQPGDESALPTAPVGIANVGNTCFWNSLLQFLFGGGAGIQEAWLAKFRAQHPDEKADCGDSTCVQCRMVTSLYNIVRHLQDAQSPSPADLRVLKSFFGGGQEQDIGEALALLAAATTHAGVGLLALLATGQWWQTSVTCSTPGCTAPRSVTLAEHTLTKLPQPRAGGCSLESLIALGLVGPAPRSEKQPTCPSCNTSSDKTISYQLLRCPNFLMLDIARISADETGTGASKNKEPVQVPLKLNMSMHAAPDASDDEKAEMGCMKLATVVVHSGPNINHGHYWTGQFIDDEVFMVSDKSVTRMTSEDAESALRQAVLLVYVKQGDTSVEGAARARAQARLARDPAAGAWPSPTASCAGQPRRLCFRPPDSPAPLAPQPREPRRTSVRTTAARTTWCVQSPSPPTRPAR